MSNYWGCRLGKASTEWCEKNAIDVPGSGRLSPVRVADHSEISGKDLCPNIQGVHDAHSQGIGI
jgi:hypothetical protein